MTTTLKPPTKRPSGSEPILPLQNGDRLSRAEFERRYEAMPDLTKAELIEGEVHMPSPVSFLTDGEPHVNIVIWLGYYKVVTPGVRVGDNSTVRLDLDNEPQPDAFALIDPECGGQARIGAEGYIEGAPELVVEVSSSTVSIDMHKKLNAYRRNGVREYIVWRVLDNEIDWFVLRDGVFVRLDVDSNGLYPSEVLPGLVLDVASILAGDLRNVSEAVLKSVQSQAHADFVKKLNDAAARA